ncbi:MAG TPA: enolase C-terminal domain-like protein [Opitutaceae bacterium]|nr:enolase C-terminal domain-like protein [Opitutaceae bacterium]
MAETAIRSVDIEPLDLPLFEPFGISGGAQAAANNVLLRIGLGDGTTGLGEGAPLPPYNGETQRGTLAALQEARSWLLGREAADWRALGREFGQRTAPGHGAARCALESALLDAVLRQQGVPMVKHFGGAGTEIETDMTVTTGTPAAAAAAARQIRQRGVRTIKVKIGGATTEGDLERIRAVVDVAPGAPLILDGNAGLSRFQASEMAAGLKRLGIAPALLEQWLPKGDLAGMRALGAETGWLIGADESVSTAGEARLVIEQGAAGVINVKLMKRGIAEAEEIVRLARAAGIRLMIGANIESPLGTAVSASFAAGLGGFHFADLDTPQFISRHPFRGGCHFAGGILALSAVGGGHGVEVGEGTIRTN